MTGTAKEVIENLMKQALSQRSLAEELKQELSTGNDQEQMQKIALALILWAYDSKHCSRAQFVECIWDWLTICSETAKQMICREQLKSVISCPSPELSGVTVNLKLAKILEKLAEILEKSSTKVGTFRHKLARFHDDLAKKDRDDD